MQQVFGNEKDHQRYDQHTNNIEQYPCFQHVTHCYLIGTEDNSIWRCGHRCHECQGRCHGRGQHQQQRIDFGSHCCSTQNGQQNLRRCNVGYELCEQRNHDSYYTQFPITSIVNLKFLSTYSWIIIKLFPYKLSLNLLQSFQEKSAEHNDNLVQ